MQLSRTVAVPFALGLATGAGAASPDTEAAMARYHTLTSVAPKGCTAAADPNTIVVCA